MLKTLQESLWFGALTVELAKTWTVQKKDPTRRKDALCLRVIKFCLESNDAHVVYEWMADCMKYNKGMC